MMHIRKLLESTSTMSFLLRTPSAAFLTLLLIRSALAQEPPAGRTLNFLITADTGILLKKAGWSKSTPAFFGAVVAVGDQLLADSKTARAIIACTDLSLRNVTDFPSGVPCEGVGPVLVYKESRVAPARDGDTSSLSVLSPRRTSLLDLHPLIRWSPLPGIAEYRVAVRGAGFNWSIDVRGKTELSYPPTAPVLSPNVAYKVTVSAGGHSSDEDKTPNLGFTIISRSDAEKVHSAEKRIRSLNLPRNAHQFLVAVLYSSSDLRADAIELLEPLRTLNEPAFLRELADLLVRVERARDALDLYQKAADISASRGDLEGQAIANGQLGNLYSSVLGNSAKGIAYFDRAIDIYKSLGDEQKLKELYQKKKSFEKN